MSALGVTPYPPEAVNWAMLHHMMYSGAMFNPYLYNPTLAAYNAAMLNPAAFGALGPGFMYPPPLYQPGPDEQQQQAGFMPPEGFGYGAMP